MTVYRVAAATLCLRRMQKVDVPAFVGRALFLAIRNLKRAELCSRGRGAFDRAAQGEDLSLLWVRCCDAGYYVVTRHADIEATFLDRESFSLS